MTIVVGVVLNTATPMSCPENCRYSSTHFQRATQQVFSSRKYVAIFQFKKLIKGSTRNHAKNHTFCTNIKYNVLTWMKVQKNKILKLRVFIKLAIPEKNINNFKFKSVKIF